MSYSIRSSKHNKRSISIGQEIYAKLKIQKYSICERGEANIDDSD